ncbi:fasciclin domain-containing protein [Adhaeribacter aquaticus]|uniref:fasciclin domain-containing protein n=1 Tax=Adhaeribacter aquaticus TaxID=299567 RepID=UPI001FE1F490|nr:fasciclin domain-containing protein [Adhaeribacter aquaticus]
MASANKAKHNSGTHKEMSKEKGVMVGGALMVPSKNIVENALGSKDHTTLVAAVKAGGLVETLMGAGPFTVFAPTNDAFNQLPAGTVETLVKPENKEKLVSILTYHVVPGRLQAKDLKNGQTLKTVNGETLTVTRKGNSVMINGATVAIADVISSNGVTHVIDKVVLPGM